MPNSQSLQAPNVGLFITCPVDLIRPSVGFATVKLLEQAGCNVSVPEQSCCGQVAFNNGLPDETRALAWNTVQSFKDFDYVVTPSGSCGGMLKHHYPELFDQDSRKATVEAFSQKVYELTSFLTEVLNYTPATPNIDLREYSLTYHDSCAGLRELGIKQQPRKLLQAYSRVQVNEMTDTDVCCGFGGTFCVKYAEVSNRMVSDKAKNIRQSGASMVLGGDLSCLLNIAGKLQRDAEQSPENPVIQVRHIAEVLAGDLSAPAIGEAVKERGKTP